MQKFFVDIAFLLHRSKRYNETKKFFYDILEDKNNQVKKYVDYFMIFLILSSVGLMVYEVKNPIHYLLDIYDYYIVTIFFAVEYMIRLWLKGNFHINIIKEYEKSQFLKSKFSIIRPLQVTLLEKFDHIRSPYAIIDLITIFPFYREIGILRVFKLLRYVRSINLFLDVLRTKKFELLTLLLILVFLMSVAGIGIYVLESNVNKNIHNVFDGIYWALVSMATVGYGDISPVTYAGKSLSMIIIVSGIMIISFATSVIVTTFYERLYELKENRVIESLSKNDSFVIICGYGQMTKMLLREDSFDNKYVIIEKSLEVAKQAIKDGYNTIVDDASRHDVLDKFNHTYSKISLICLGNNDIENIYITLNAKSISSDIRVVARASSISMEKKFKIAGADHVIIPNLAANTMLLTAINNPVMYGVMHSFLSGKNAAYLDEIRVVGYDNLVGKKIEAIGLKEHRLLLIGLKRGSDFVFNPSKEIELQSDDILLVMGLKISIEYFHKIVQASL